MMPVGGYREPFRAQHTIPTRDQHGILHWPTDLILDGPAVLSFSTQRIPPSVEKLLQHTSIVKDSIDHFIFHQANRMINETIRKKLGLPIEKVPSTLHDLGNTSGASLPITVTARLHEQLNGTDARMLLCGFGIGLSWGTAIVELENAIFPALIEQ
jgi:3-oxoacyl-[acyl-carrier-protein] synthase-3